MKPEDLLRQFAQKDSSGNEYGTGPGFSGEQRNMPARPKGLLDKIDSAMSEIDAAKHKEKEDKIRIHTQTETREVAYYRCSVCGKHGDKRDVCYPKAVYST